VATLIGLVAALATVLILNALAFGIDLSISPLEIALWAVGAAILAVAVARVVSAGLVGGWMDIPKRRRTAETAEALSRLKRGDVAGAEGLLRRSLEANPADADAARALAEVALRRGDHERYLQLTGQLLGQADALRRGERVALCHRQADICVERLADPARAVEALARVELDYPGTADAVRARQRIDRILAVAAGEVSKTD
jgi:thioredoxin-like negative regulator of GroEL